jgi:hypothetical protein
MDCFFSAKAIHSADQGFLQLRKSGLNTAEQVIMSAEMVLAVEKQG